MLLSVRWVSSRRAGLPSSASRSAWGQPAVTTAFTTAAGQGCRASEDLRLLSRGGGLGGEEGAAVRCAGRVVGVVVLPALAHCHESERQSRPDRAHARAHMHARDGDRPHARSIVRAAAVAVHALAVEAAHMRPRERQRLCAPAAGNPDRPARLAGAPDPRDRRVAWALARRTSSGGRMRASDAATAGACFLAGVAAWRCAGLVGVLIGSLSIVG